MKIPPNTSLLKAPSAADQRHAAVEKQVGKWVSQTFFGTLLKQMRSSPFRSELFDGGRGGEAFGSLMDQQLADKMSRGAGKKLVNAIVSKIEGSKAYRSHSKEQRHAPTAGA